MVLRLLSRVRVTAAYAVALAGVALVLVALGPDVRERIVRHASTNLHNLSHGHLGTLIGSAFVTAEGPIYGWLPGLVCLLALGELLWRSGRLVVAFAVGHIGATLLVAAGLTSAVEFGWLPAAVSRATDVGMSYGAAAVLGTLTCALPRRWRAGWVGWWLAVGVTAVLMSRAFTDVGHTVALVLGMVLSTRFGRPARWTRPLVLLLVIAAGFGYLMMAGSGLSLALAAGAGILGATAGHVLARRRMLAAAVLVGGPPALG